jgi:hypothetical protein
MFVRDMASQLQAMEERMKSYFETCNAETQAKVVAAAAKPQIQPAPGSTAPDEPTYKIYSWKGQFRFVPQGFEFPRY